MVARRVLALTLALLVAILAFPFTARASVSDLVIEQVQAELPDVRVYFHLNGDAPPEQAELGATLGGAPLQITGLRKADPALDKPNYFFLVDCSTSTTAAQMDGVKQALRQFVGNMDEYSTMTLITFGVELGTPLLRETDTENMLAAIDALAADQPGTLFFDALAKAMDLAASKPYALERKLAFVFSDSVDYNLGGHTKEEVDAMLAASGLPFYALGFDTGSKQELDNFGAVARASGGDIAVVAPEGIPDALAQMVKHANSAWVASFRAGTNIIAAPVQELALTLDAHGLAGTKQVPVRHWQADATTPAVAGIEQISGESIRVRFSEPVDGAALAESYAVRDGGGNLLGIAAATYEEASNTAVLTFASAPQSDTYTLECPGVADRSTEQNRVAAASPFAFEGAPLEAPPSAPVSPGAWIFISLAGLAVIAGLSAAAVRKKRRNAAAPLPGAADGSPAVRQTVAQPAPQGGEVQVHFSETPVELPKIKLNVTGPGGRGNVVELPVNKTLFVGRSDICDVFFDDPSMSRQHFAIGEEDGLYTVTNLSASGGTFLNGVRLQNPRPLQNGDTIRAGGQSIVFFAN